MQAQFKVGDKVKVARKLSQGTYTLLGFDNAWTEGMDRCVGKESTIVEISEWGIYLEDSIYFFPPSCLDLVKAKGGIDWTKPVQTREGQSVEIVLTNARGEYPIMGYIEKAYMLTRWTEGGEYLKADADHPLNLQNIPETKEIWVNIMQNQDGSIFTCTFDSREAAIVGAGDSMSFHGIKILAQQKFTFTSGTFDKE